MIIDVVELELETLNFTRRYDPARYRRGTTIYNNGLVEIESVDKKDEGTYLVEASVEGNYDTYRTTLEIKENTIKQSTCTCEDYYGGNLCKHIIATSMEVIEPHYASTKEGKKRFEEKKREEERKRLEEIRKRQEEERKKREYERKYHSGLRTIESYKQNSRQRSTNTLDLAELYETTTEMKKKKQGELATSIKLEYNVELGDAETLRLTFKIGQTRMYVLNNIGEFYEAYKNESELCYGKQLRFIPKRENFVEESKEIFDYIIKNAQMMEYREKYSNYTMLSALNKVIYVTGDNIDEFFDINKNKDIVLNSYYCNEKYEFTNQRLDISCVLTKEKVEIPIYDYWYYGNGDVKESEEYVLKLNIGEHSTLISNKKMYIFNQNKMYIMEKDNNIIKILDMYVGNDKILIPEDKLEEVKNVVLSQIKYFKTENLPEDIKKEYQRKLYICTC